jgi:hypothetical protein
MRILAIITLAVVTLGFAACQHKEATHSTGTMPPAKGYHK